MLGDFVHPRRGSLLIDLDSCIGQNLEFTSSTYVAELLFTIAVAIVGLVLFALLIGNMQVSNQSILSSLSYF